MEELAVYLAIAAAVILFIVYVVLPIIGILLAIGGVILGIISLAGFVSGLGVGITNFFAVLQEAHESLP